MHNWTILHRTLGLQDTSLLHPIKERLLWEGGTEDTLKFLLTTGTKGVFTSKFTWLLMVPTGSPDIQLASGQMCRGKGAYVARSNFTQSILPRSTMVGESNIFPSTTRAFVTFHQP